MAKKSVKKTVSKTPTMPKLPKGDLCGVCNKRVDDWQNHAQEHKAKWRKKGEPIVQIEFKTPSGKTRRA